MKKYVSIDIGITNMGLITATVDTKEWIIVSIDHVERVDINDLPHLRVSRQQCTLHHTRNMVDKMGHFLQEYAPYFEEAEEVLIERQPMQGLQAVEQLFLSLLEDRDTIRQKHPTPMHKHFGIDSLDYEGRKEKTVEFGREYLKGMALVYFNSLERKHDISDAICQLVFHIDERRKAMCYKRRVEAEPDRALWRGQVPA